MTFAESLRAKGLRDFTARPALILSRFGPTAARMERRLSIYASLVEQFGAGLTIPATASVVARHPTLIRSFLERKVEFAIHGMVHEDHSLLRLDEQRSRMARAVATFQAVGVPVTGFRGPYLQFNDSTDQALREVGLLYHSSQAVAFGSNGAALPPGYARAAAYYKAEGSAGVAVRPRDRNGLVHIPVALPDDEIMVDRLHLDEGAQAAAWLSILDVTYARGDLFTVQLHPERILEAGFALRTVLEECRRRTPRVWLANLGDLATWWRRRAECTLEVQRLDSGRFRVLLQGDTAATLLVRGLPPESGLPWYGAEMVARSRTLDVESVRKPVVGVTPRTVPAVVSFVREEGFPTEVSQDANSYGAYLDVSGTNWNEVGILAAIDASPGPVLRLGRWPNAARSALAVTGDLDSVTIQDFAFRLWETRRHPPKDSPSSPEPSGA